MSNSVLTWVWNNSPTTGSERLILLAIADQANDDGEAFPSQGSIAKRARLHPDTVEDGLRRMISRGELEREQRPGRSNVYRVVMRDEHAPPVPTPRSTTPRSETGGSYATPTPRSETPPPPGQRPPHNPQEPSEEPSPTNKRRAPRPKQSLTPAPDDFEITNHLRAWAASRNVTCDLDEATEEFLNHHRAKGSEFKNWDAAWQTWMTRTKRYGGPQRPGTALAPRNLPADRPSTTDIRTSQALAAGAEVQALFDDRLGGAA
jgi:hypothetical protein